MRRVNYKTFDADEAEERFAERGKILNHWAVMVNKKLKPEKEGEESEDLEEAAGSKRKGKGKSGFKISDMDDWVESGDELDSDEDDKEKDEGNKKSARSKDSKKKKKKKDEADSEGFEDSDDGDDEGREVDYMSDESSESETEMLEEALQKGVDQDKALSKMLDSDDSEEEEGKEDGENDEEDEEEQSRKKKRQEDGGQESGEETPSKKKGKGSKNSSRAATPTPDGDGGRGESGGGGGGGGGGSDEATAAKAVRAEKRRALVEDIMDPNASKRSRMDGPLSQSSGGGGGAGAAVSSAEAAFEEDVRRYLARKPMTATEILKKFRSKNTGIDKDQLVQMLGRVLKRINPHRQRTKGTMYLSLKK